MVSIPLDGSTPGDRRLRRLFAELKKVADLTVRRKGATLFRQGGRPRGAFLMASGHARLWMKSHSGGMVAFDVISAPCILSLPATMGRRSYNFTAVLDTDARIARLDRRSILQVLQKHQALALCVVELLGRGVSEMTSHPKRARRKTTAA